MLLTIGAARPGRKGRCPLPRSDWYFDDPGDQHIMESEIKELREYLHHVKIKTVYKSQSGQKPGYSKGLDGVSAQSFQLTPTDLEPSIRKGEKKARVNKEWRFQA